VSPALRRILTAPAVQALLILCLAFPLMLAVVFLLARAGMAPTYLHAALAHGAIAAVLTWWRGLAGWWRAIQFLFPLALLGAQQLALPPAVFLAGFVILLLVFWSTFRTQVPYYPSTRAVWDALAAQLPPGRPLCVIDIGSGLGGAVLELARRRPDSAFVGIELAPLPWLLSRLRAALSGSRARFVRGDYETLDFGAYDAVFAYLSPAAMSALWRKASTELRPGSLLISYEFAIEGHTHDICVVPTVGGPSLYIWHF
jgi:energy-coupling factor transporter transmembrane protein EcfT